MNGGAARCNKRLQKELEDLKKYEETLKVETDPKNFCIWKVSFKGAEKTLYTGEEFTLQFKFSNEYVRIYLIETS
jgi:ubiquitin-protein ligase